MAVPINGTSKGAVAGTKGETTPHVVNNGGTSLGTSNGRLDRPLGSHRQGARPPQDETMQGPANPDRPQSAALTDPVWNQMIQLVGNPFPSLSITDGCPTIHEQIQINRDSGIEDKPYPNNLFSPYLPDCGRGDNYPSQRNPLHKCCDANELGSCRYRFRIEPQSVFNRISKDTGEDIPLSVREDILKELIQPIRNDDGSLIQGKYRYRRGDHAKFICDGVSDLLECINPDKKCRDLLLSCGEIAEPPCEPYEGKRTMVAKVNMRTEADVRNCDNWRFYPRADVRWQWWTGQVFDTILKCLALSKAEEKIYSPAGTTRIPCSGQTLEPADTDYTPFSGNTGSTPAFEVFIDPSVEFIGGVEDKLVYIEIISVIRTLKIPRPEIPEPEDYITTITWRYGTADAGTANICEIANAGSGGGGLITWSAAQQFANRNEDGTPNPFVVTPEYHQPDAYGGLENPGCDYMLRDIDGGVQIAFYCLDDWYEKWTAVGGGQSVMGTFGAWWVAQKRWGRFEPDPQNEYRCKPPTPLESNCSCKKSFFMDWLSCVVNCDNWCCEYLGFPSSANETNMTDAGWAGITSETYCKERRDKFCWHLQDCTCRDNNAMLTDCGCVDIDDESDPYDSSGDDRFSDDTGPSCPSSIVVHDTSVPEALSPSLTVEWTLETVLSDKTGRPADKLWDGDGVNITIDGGSLPVASPHDGSFCVADYPAEDCELMGLEYDTTYTLKVWTYDQNGNYTYCKTLTYPTQPSP